MDDPSSPEQGAERDAWNYAGLPWSLILYLKSHKLEMPSTHQPSVSSTPDGDNKDDTISDSLNEPRDLHVPELNPPEAETAISSTSNAIVVAVAPLASTKDESASANPNAAPAASSPARWAHDTPEARALGALFSILLAGPSDFIPRTAVGAKFAELVRQEAAPKMKFAKLIALAGDLVESASDNAGGVVRLRPDALPNTSGRILLEVLSGKEEFTPANVAGIDFQQACQRAQLPPCKFAAAVSGAKHWIESDSESKADMDSRGLRIMYPGMTVLSKSIEAPVPSSAPAEKAAADLLVTMTAPIPPVVSAASAADSSGDQLMQDLLDILRKTAPCPLIALGSAYGTLMASRGLPFIKRKGGWLVRFLQQHPKLFRLEWAGNVVSQITLVTPEQVAQRPTGASESEQKAVPLPDVHQPAPSSDLRSESHTLKTDGDIEWLSTRLGGAIADLPRTAVGELAANDPGALPHISSVNWNHSADFVRLAAAPSPAHPAASEELDALFNILPTAIASAIRERPADSLVDIVLDLGRVPKVHVEEETKDGRRRIKAHALPLPLVTEVDIQTVLGGIGTLSADNRAGIPHTLHRVSALRARDGSVIGFTMRVGRVVYGSLKLMGDIVSSGKSVLLVGAPGVGKTTVLREMARVLSDEYHKRVMVVDTSNEIAGDARIPHSGIGSARRIEVPTPNKQALVMLEAVQNHTPEVIIVDEIGSRDEVVSMQAIAHRGVRLVATVHGTSLWQVVNNPSVCALIGGVHPVILSDAEAKLRESKKTVMQRQHPPVYDVAIEITSRSSWVVYPDVAVAVDNMLLRNGEAMTRKQPTVKVLAAQRRELVRQPNGTEVTRVLPYEPELL